MRNCPSAQLPLFLTYELLRQSQNFNSALIHKRKASQNCFLTCENWNLGKIISPVYLDGVLKYFPTPWLALPASEKERISHQITPFVPLRIRGEDLLAMIMLTCFQQDDAEGNELEVPPIKTALDKGNVVEAMFDRVPILRFGGEYILTEIDRSKSMDDLLREFRSGLLDFDSEKNASRADSIKDKLDQVLVYRLRKVAGGYTGTQKFLKLHGIRSFSWEEKSFYRIGKFAIKLVEDFDREVKTKVWINTDTPPWDEPVAR